MADHPADAWTGAELATLDRAEEIRVRTRRRDGSLRSPRIIWVVTVDEDVVVRSANGREAQWFRWALATGAGALVVGAREIDVRFTEVDDAGTLAAADAAYESSYGRRYAGIVRSLNGPGPRAATLLVTKA